MKIITAANRSGLPARTIFISHQSDYISKYEQFLVFDHFGIAAAVGGGLGLFLGVSVYSIITDAMDKFLALRKKYAMHQCPNNSTRCT